MGTMRGRPTRDAGKEAPPDTVETFMAWVRYRLITVRVGAASSRRVRFPAGPQGQHKRAEGVRSI